MVGTSEDSAYAHSSKYSVGSSIRNYIRGAEDTVAQNDIFAIFQNFTYCNVS